MQQQSTQTQSQTSDYDFDHVEQDNAALDALLGITSTHTHMDDIPRIDGFGVSGTVDWGNIQAE